MNSGVLEVVPPLHLDLMSAERVEANLLLPADVQYQLLGLMDVQCEVVLLTAVHQVVDLRPGLG